MLESEAARWAVEVSSFALVAWLMTQTFSKTLPTLTEQFRQDLQSQREASERSLGEVTTALRRLAILIISHDATVRGQNPEARSSVDELMRILRIPNHGKEQP